MGKSTIFIFDNDVVDMMSLKEQLSAFDFEVFTVLNKNELMHYVKQYEAGIVLMNLTLEGNDAISLCQEIRGRKDIKQPFIIIYSEKNEDYVQITSFNSGADDYLIKPLKATILAARFKALLRRRIRIQTEKKHSKKNLVIDIESYKIIKSGVSYSLPRKEFEMLNLLVSNPNKVFTRKEMAIALWNNEEVAKQRTIDIHVRNIRKQIGKEVIKTLKGVGYCIS
jgi:two-component system alkaline phosphatase synthesis response regulator PhoP